jgi:anaerobic C4-dicarboxylate transporter-like protein
MDTVLFIVEALVVVGAILMGTRASGVGLGLWGGFGVFVLVFIFQEDPGTIPTDAVFIVLTVVLAAAAMQAAGGIDWMVSIAAKIIESRPQQIVFIAPLVSFVFCLGAGTGNILFPLLPVIYDVSYANKIRPSRPLALAVVASGIALAASPVAAAMAAMTTLTDVEPYNFNLVHVLAITIPASLVGIVAAAFFTRHLGAELEDDPEYQRRVAAGELDPPDKADATAGELASTSTGRLSAIFFLVGVGMILVLGLFSDLRPTISGANGSEPISMTTTIEIIMFTVGTLIVLFCHPKSSDIPNQSIFTAGVVSAIALFGLAWLTDTFIAAHEDAIVDTIGNWVADYQFIFAIAVALVAALTTSQSTATRTIVPIGLAAGLSVGVVAGMWPAIGAVFVLPTNGGQIAAVNFDRTGTTTLGTKLVDHSFFLPLMAMLIPAVVFGAILGTFF